ncbi:reverse transcriptase domain-containing protein [Tanacetum coccineum]
MPWVVQDEIGGYDWSFQAEDGSQKYFVIIDFITSQAFHQKLHQVSDSKGSIELEVKWVHVCRIIEANCKRVGHLTRDCWSSAATNNQRTLTCYECGNQGHYRSDCPELKNRNHGNQAEGTEARGMVYALEGGDTDQDLNNIEDEIEA